MSKRKILVVDDESDYRNLVKIALPKSDYEIIEASNGKKALEEIYKSIPDLILLDLNMPVMDGYAVCRKIRSDTVCRHIPVIMLTVKKTPASQSKGLDIGADDYIIKPFNSEELHARIKSVLHRSAPHTSKEENV